MEKVKKLIKNPYFWIVFTLIILGVLIYFIIGTPKSNKKGYLLISNINSLECNNTVECKIISNEEIEEEENQSNYIVYEDKKYLGEYKIEYINKWNFFDLNNNWINLQSNFIAGSKNTNLVVKEYSTRTMYAEEINLLNKILLENNIKTYSSLVQNEVLEYDFDKDDSAEKIILASNVTDTSADEKLFAIVIGIINNKSYVLHLDVYNQYENFEVPAYNIKGIINLFEEKEAFLVLLKGYYSEVGDPRTYIYQVNNKKFKMIITEE